VAEATSKAIATASERGVGFGASFEKSIHASVPWTSKDPASAQPTRAPGQWEPDASACAACSERRHLMKTHLYHEATRITHTAALRRTTATLVRGRTERVFRPEKRADVKVVLLPDCCRPADRDSILKEPLVWRCRGLRCR
jgi:hypothetical protein